MGVTSQQESRSAVSEDSKAGHVSNDVESVAKSIQTRHILAAPFVETVGEVGPNRGRRKECNVSPSSRLSSHGNMEEVGV